jgi:hypothetical protein
MSFDMYVDKITFQYMETRLGWRVDSSEKSLCGVSEMREGLGESRQDGVWPGRDENRFPDIDKKRRVCIYLRYSCKTIVRNISHLNITVVQRSSQARPVLPKLVWWSPNDFQKSNLRNVKWA